MKYLVLLALFMPTDVVAANCVKHPIYCQIIENNSTLNKKYAMKLSNIIHKYSRRYKIDARIYTAILAQESMYKLNTVATAVGLVKEESDWIVTRISTDFGISQIHYRTTERYKFEIEKLTTDLDYAVDAGAKVLRDFKKSYSKTDNFWWTRYNAFNKDKRKEYRRKVERYF